MSEFISYAVSLLQVKLYMLQHFTKKSVESKASGKAVRMKRCIRLNLKAKISQFFLSRVLMLRFLVLQDHMGSTVFVADSYGIYLAAQQRNKVINFRFVLTLACFSAYTFCDRLARSTQKLNFLFSNFCFGVLHSHVMFQCIEFYLTKTEPGIRFQQPFLIKSLYLLI